QIDLLKTLQFFYGSRDAADQLTDIKLHYLFTFPVAVIGDGDGRRQPLRALQRGAGKDQVLVREMRIAKPVTKWINGVVGHIQVIGAEFLEPGAFQGSPG